MATEQQLTQLAEQLKQQGLTRSEILPRLKQFDAENPTPFIGPEEPTPTITQAAFPTVTQRGLEPEERGISPTRKVVGAFTDPLGLPSRIVKSIPSPPSTPTAPGVPVEVQKGAAEEAQRKAQQRPPFLERVTKAKPELGLTASLAAIPFTGGISGLTGAGLRGFAARGAAEAGIGATAEEAGRFAETGEIQPLTALLQTGAGAGLGAVTPLAVPAAQKLSRFTNKLAGKITGFFRGKKDPSEEALRFFGTKEGAKQLKALGPNAQQTLKELIQDVDKFNEFENTQVKEIVAQMGDIPVDRVVNIIQQQINKLPKETFGGVRKTLEKLMNDIQQKSVIPGITITGTSRVPQQIERQIPQTTQQVGKVPVKPELGLGQIEKVRRGALGEIIPERPQIKEGFTRTFPGKTITEEQIIEQPFTRQVSQKEITENTMDAVEFKKFEGRLDDLIDWKKKGANALNDAKIAIRTQMAEELRQEAVRIGNPEFIEIMDNLSNKIKAQEFIQKNIGTPTTLESKRLNKLTKLLDDPQIIERFSTLLEKDFTNDAQLLRLASELGEKGRPSLFPSTFVRPGAAIGAGAFFDPLLGGTLAALSSPRAQAGILGALDVTERGLAGLSPAVIRRLRQAGETGRRGLQALTLQQQRNQ